MNIFYYLFSLVLMLTLDGLWIGTNKAMYRGAAESIQRQPMKINVLATFLAYVLLYAAIVVLALPTVAATPDQRQTKDMVFSIFKKSVWHGGRLGFAVYGVYNLTTKAILHKYPWKVCAMDTLWGTVMFTLVCFFSVLLTKSCKHRGKCWTDARPLQNKK